MKRVIWFDMGETLVHGLVPFPGVKESLQVIRNLKTQENTQLKMGIISDYEMPITPITEQKIQKIELKYRHEVLQASGLEEYFSDFETQITISTRAGVRKPDRKIFELAFKRMGLPVTFSESVFITENSDHLQKVAEMGITPVLFGAVSATMTSFMDWVDAPALISNLVDPDNQENLSAAIAPALEAKHGFVGLHPDQITSTRISGTVRRLFQLNDPKLGPLDGVYVEGGPSQAEIELGSDGRVINAVASDPKSEDVDDAINFVSSLLHSGKIKLPDEHQGGLGITHVVERDTSGRNRLIRKRYS